MTVEASEGRMLGTRRLIISERNWYRVWSILIKSINNINIQIIKVCSPEVDSGTEEIGSGILRISWWYNTVFEECQSQF